MRHSGRSLRITSVSLVLILSPAARSMAVSGVELPAKHLAAGQDQSYQQGLLALRDGHLELAVEYLAKAETQRPSDPAVRNFRGVALAQAGRYPEAEAEYREAIHIDPNFEAAYRNLGFLAWNTRQWDTAMDALQKALALAPDDGFARYYLGRIKLDTGAYSEGFAELERSGMRVAEDPAYLSSAAAGYVALGRQAEARTVIDRLADQPLNEAERVHLASLMLSVHENDPAIHLLRTMLQAHPQTSASLLQFDLSLALLLSGNDRESAKEAEGLMHPDGNFVAAQACTVAGIAKARSGDGAGAITAFRKAVQFDPDSEESWLNLTRELMEQNQYSEAIAATEQAVTAHPRSYALQLRLGSANLSAARYAEAERIFRGLVDAGDPLPTSSIGLAQVLLRTSRADEAVAVLAAARQRLGDSFLLSYFAGLALDRTGKRAEAATAFADAVKQNPENAEARFGLGKTELAQGHLPAAIEALEAAKRLNPGDVQTERLLDQALRRAGGAPPLAQDQGKQTLTPAATPDLVGDFSLPPWKELPEKPLQQIPAPRASIRP
jgi:tetratricopeptide (TPR) repeat protein